MKRIRIALLGVGAIAQIAHLPVLRSLTDRFEIRYLCDLAPEVALAATAKIPYAVAATDDWERTLRDPEVDAVMILTPGAHGSEVVRALEHGKHVFSEKPLCLTTRELRRIADSAQARGLHVQVGYMKTHEDALPWAQERLHDIGEPSLVRVTVLHPSEARQQAGIAIQRPDIPPQSPPDGAPARDLVTQALGPVPDRIAWFHREVAHGSLVHQIAATRAILGSLPTHFQVVDSWPPDWLTTPSPIPPPSLITVGRFANGVAFELDWLWLPAYPEYSEDVTVFGERGSLRIEFPPPYRIDAVASGQMLVDRSESMPTTVATVGTVPAFRRQLESFHERVVHKRDLAAGLDGVGLDIQALERLTKAFAAHHGLSITPPLPGSGPNTSVLGYGMPHRKPHSAREAPETDRTP